MGDLERELDIKENLSKAVVEYLCFKGKGTTVSFVTIDSLIISLTQVGGKIVTTFSVGGEILL